MVISDFFYPEIKICIGDYIFTEGIESEVVSTSESYFDWAKIKFTKGFNQKITLHKRDLIKVMFGYAGELNEIFSGYLSKSGSEKNQVVFKDQMIILEETSVTNTFLDVTPQEIIKYMLDKAGITNYKISDEIYSYKSRFVVYEKNCISLLNEINTEWNINVEFFFQNGVFYWGCKPEQKYKYTFEYRKNIISLEKTNEVWELVTVSVPLLKHGDIIGIEHYQISGDFTVKKVIFTSDNDGFIRTKIYF